MNKHAYNILTTLIIILSITLLPASIHGAGNQPFTVVIDAGHGGKDTGACDNNVKEKDINLGVALQLEQLIKKELKNVKVVMTRDNDTFLTLQQRADKANAAKGNLFISIHTNSVDESNKNRRTVAGASVYALGLHKDDNNKRVAMRENSVIELEKNFEEKYSGFDPAKDESYIIFEMAQKKNLSQSIKFADDVQKQLVKVAGRANRGVHQAGFWVLWATSMPSVLIEVDFICNPNSAKFIASTEGQKQLAQAIFNSVKSYSESYIKNNTAGKKTAREEKKIDTSTATPIATLTSIESDKRTDTPPAVASDAKRSRAGYSSTSRKRRSASSRATSQNRNFETDSIPLHSDNERLAMIDNVEVEEITNFNDEPAQQPTMGNSKKKASSKEKKTKTANNASGRRYASRERAKLVTVYQIQLLATHERLTADNPNFQGLKPISCFRDKDFYKYTYGESEDKSEIENLLKEVKKKIPDAYVIKLTKSSTSKSL